MTLMELTGKGRVTKAEQLIAVIEGSRFNLVDLVRLKVYVDREVSSRVGGGSAEQEAVLRRVCKEEA